MLVCDLWCNPTSCWKRTGWVSWQWAFRRVRLIALKSLQTSVIRGKSASTLRKGRINHASSCGSTEGGLSFTLLLSHFTTVFSLIYSLVGLGVPATLCCECWLPIVKRRLFFFFDSVGTRKQYTTRTLFCMKSAQPSATWRP